MANLKNPVKAIHAFCIECMGENPRNCIASETSSLPCPLYPFRNGKNPFRAKHEMTSEQKAAMVERLTKNRNTNNTQTS